MRLEREYRGISGHVFSGSYLGDVGDNDNAEGAPDRRVGALRSVGDGVFVFEADNDSGGGSRGG